MEDAAYKLVKDNPLEDEMGIKQGHDSWKQFCSDTLSDPHLLAAPENKPV